MTATLYGLNVLAPKFFGAAPDVVVTGPNVGGNVGFVTDFISGTMYVPRRCRPTRGTNTHRYT